MEAEEMRKAFKTRPFVPFRINLADGRRIDVKHPDYMWMTPKGRTCFVATEGEGTEIIDVAIIQSITLLQAA